MSEDKAVFVVGTADSASDVAPPLRRIFTHELEAGMAQYPEKPTYNSFITPATIKHFLVWKCFLLD